jgi:phage terminase large subunit
MLIETTAQKKISKLKKRIRIVQGGTSSSKTFSILPLLIQYAWQCPKSEISVVSESIPHLKRGAIRDFLKIMDWTGNLNYSRWNKSSLTYHFANGSFIEFFSADQPDKLRGARRDILFINECNNVAFESYQQLAIRTKKFIYLDYNPTSEFWVHSELSGEIDSDFIILTYKDNEALAQSIVTEIEKAKIKAQTSEYWANWWKVYGLGQVGSLQGIIFDDWKHIDNIPNESKYLGTGIDFGYTNDPTTIIDLYQLGNDIYLDEQMYLTNQTNNDIAKFLKSKQNKGLNVADSAEPKSIKEISLQGVNIVGAAKGPDSIKNGIDLLKRFNVHVTKRSLNIIKEQRNYKWKTDNENKATNQPIDAFNHTMDAIRYIASHVLKTNVYSRKARIW